MTSLAIKHAIYIEKEKTRLLLEKHLTDEQRSQLRKHFQHFTSWSGDRCGRFVVEVTMMMPAFVERVMIEQKGAGNSYQAYHVAALYFLKIHNAVRCKRPSKKVAIAVKAVTFIGALIEGQPYAADCANILIKAAQRSV